MKRIICAVTLSLALLSGCHSASSTNPPTPPTLDQTYSRAAQAMQNFSADVRQAQQIEISLFKGGVIGKPMHVAVQNGFLQTAMYGKQIDALIAGQAGAATIQAKVAQALQSVHSITLATGTLDASATAQLKATITALTLILNTVSSTFDQITGELHVPGTYRRISGTVIATNYDHLPAVQAGTERGWIAG